MKTKFNVGDTVLIKGIVETIHVETADNEPIYCVRIKGAGTYEAYGIRVKEDVMRGSSECNRDCKDCPDKIFDSDSSQEFICNKDGHIVR